VKDPRDIILRPIISEKICDAVEAIWNVKVRRVNTLNRRGKMRQTRGTNRFGQRPNTKRAIVTLEAGNEIPLFEN
jgi:large subunit ribosomal protein L23